MPFPSEREDVRWLAARNTGSVPIPSFGICCHVRSDPFESERGVLIYHVSQPTEEQAASNNAAICFANSPQLILPGKTGRITQEWPAQILLDSEIDQLLVHERCGPRKNEPTIHGGWGPFSYLGDDPTLPIEFGNGIKVGIISPSSQALSIAFELKDELTALSTTPVAAYRRVFDPEANNGDGGFVTDCDDEILVADMRKVGYYGDTGAHGAGEPRHAKNGIRHVIVDECCPGDEDPSCS